MNLRYIRGGFTASHEYVCLSCRLQCRLSQARQNLRRQHTATQSADSIPRLPDGAGRALRLQSILSKPGRGEKSQESNAVLNTLPARKAKQVQLTLQQKFLEKRYQESSTPSTATNADVAPSSEASRPISKRNKKKGTAAKLIARRMERAKKDSTEARKESDAEQLTKKTISPKKKNTIAKHAAQGTEERPQKDITGALKASDAGKLGAEIVLSKKKIEKVKKGKKPKDGAKNDDATTWPSGTEFTAKLKSDVAELQKAPKSKIKNERNLEITPPVSKLLKKLKPSTASDLPKSSEAEKDRKLQVARKSLKRSKPSTLSETPKPSPSPRKIGKKVLRRTSNDTIKEPYTPKPEMVVAKVKEEESPRPTIRIRSRRRIQATPRKVLTSTKLENVTGHESLEAALRPNSEEGNAQTTKVEIEKLNAEDLKLTPIEANLLPVPTLAYGLERVLFNPGVYQLQDPRSKVFNFDPYLQKIMPVADFDFDALKEYITSSRDQSLKQLAQVHRKRYVGSSSSMTGVLAHFHFLLSQWRSINTTMLSKTFPDPYLTFTELQRTPSAIFLRWQDGSYAIDADKQFDTANILMMLGKSMEKLLTLDTADFERYRKSNPEQVTEEERNAPESFHYTTMGDLLMRSQLDAFDSRLPGTGMFDLKTRAVVSIRMEPQSPHLGVGYQIKSAQGDYESFEREYYDMIRAAFLKYSLQVRMGRMDGIFVAYHNTERIFGFQYISIEEMDFSLHGQRDTSVGDQEFKLSLKLLNEALDKATKRYPEKTLRLHFETRDVDTPFMYIFAEPVTEEQVQEIQTQNNEKYEAFQRKLMGLEDEISESESAQKGEDKWADIQADVREAMARDEMSVCNWSEEKGLPGRAVKESISDSNSVQFSKDDSLYKIRDLDQADENGFVTAAGSEEDDGEEEEETEEVEGEGEDGQENGAENVEIDDQNKIIDEADDLAKVEAEEQVRMSTRDATTKLFGSASHDGDVEEVIDNGNRVNESDAGGEMAGHVAIGLDDEGDESDQSEEPGFVAELDGLMQGAEGGNESGMQKEEPEVLAQEIIAEGQEPEVEAASSLDPTSHGRDSSDQRISQSDIEVHPASSDQYFDTRADHSFLEEMDHEYSPDSDSEVFAMALTVRNKVNDNYVQRPENIGPDDKWSIEYSLEEISKQKRAWSLYRACQQRRRAKLESFENRDGAETVNEYVKQLRGLSQKGALWRKEMDRKEKGRKVAVVGQPMPPREEVTKPAEQQPED